MKNYFVKNELFETVTSIPLQDGKYLLFDTETTGVTGNSSIVTIAGIVFKVLNNKPIFNKFFYYKCQPFEGAHIDPNASNFNGIYPEDWEKWEMAEEMYKALIEVFDSVVNKYDVRDKLIPIGHNVDFDKRMLMALFRHFDNKFLGSYIDYKTSYDTLAMARDYLPANKELLEYSEKSNNRSRFFVSNTLENLVKVFYPELLIEFHDAQEDIYATWLLLNVFRNNTMDRRLKDTVEQFGVEFKALKKNPILPEVSTTIEE